VNKELIERIKAATARPTVADAILEPVREKINNTFDKKIKPQLLRPGDLSGKKYVYVDPRIDPKDLW